MNLRIALATAALGAAALFGLTACGPADASDTLTPEASALTALGYDSDDVTASGRLTDSGPDASAAPDASGRAKHGRRDALKLRRALAHNVEHGEVVVQTKQGDKTIDIQRGEVTAINDTSVTVKSADGFSQTWTLGNPLRVIERRSSVQASAVKVGTKIGVAGVKNGSIVTANLIVIPLAK